MLKRLDHLLLTFFFFAFFSVGSWVRSNLSFFKRSTYHFEIGHLLNISSICVSVDGSPPSQVRCMKMWICTPKGGVRDRWDDHSSSSDLLILTLMFYHLMKGLSVLWLATSTLRYIYIYIKIFRNELLVEELVHLCLSSRSTCCIYQTSFWSI